MGGTLQRAAAGLTAAIPWLHRHRRRRGPAGDRRRVRASTGPAMRRGRCEGWVTPRMEWAAPPWASAKVGGSAPRGRRGDPAGHPPSGGREARRLGSRGATSARRLSPTVPASRSVPISPSARTLSKNYTSNIEVKEEGSSPSPLSLSISILLLWFFFRARKFYVVGGPFRRSFVQSTRSAAAPMYSNDSDQSSMATWRRILSERRAPNRRPGHVSNRTCSGQNLSAASERMFREL